MCTQLLNFKTFFIAFRSIAKVWLVSIKFLCKPFSDLTIIFIEKGLYFIVCNLFLWFLAIFVPYIKITTYNFSGALNALSTMNNMLFISLHNQSMRLKCPFIQILQQNQLCPHLVNWSCVIRHFQTWRNVFYETWKFVKYLLFADDKWSINDISVRLEAYTYSATDHQMSLAVSKPYTWYFWLLLSWPVKHLSSIHSYMPFNVSLTKFRTQFLTKPTNTLSRTIFCNYLSRISCHPLSQCLQCTNRFFHFTLLQFDCTVYSLNDLSNGLYVEAPWKFSFPSISDPCTS